MPWSSDQYPDAFKNLPAAKRKRAIAMAEAIRKACRKSSGDEKECAAKAIRIALWRIKQGRKTMNQEMRLAEPTRLSRIVRNFNANVRGVDIAVDVGHDPGSGAAAWIKALKLDASSADPNKKAIYANVQWTDYGKEIAGEDKKFRYISSEYGKFIDAETGQIYEDVMAAVTLTNRPAIKWMQPVEPVDGWIEILREGDYQYIKESFPDGKQTVMAQEPEQLNLLHKAMEALTAFFAKPSGGDVHAVDLSEVNMDAEKEKKLRDLLVGHGMEIEEDGDVIAVLTDFLVGRDEKIADLEEKLAAEPEVPEEAEEDKAKLVEAESALTKLQESNAELGEQVATLAQTIKDKDRDVFFSEMLAEGKLRPADTDSYKKLYAADDKTTIALLTEGPTVVDLEEHGSSSAKTEDKMDGFITKIAKLAEEKGITREEAFEILAEAGEMPVESDE